MKTYPPAEQTRRIFQDLRNRISDSRFFRDRMSVALLVLAFVLNLLTFAWLVIKVRPTDVPVPVRYSNLLSGFDQLGPWYFPFLIAAYALGVTILNGLFAYHSFGRSRLVSFFLLSTSNVVAAFGFIVAAAFGVVR